MLHNLLPEVDIAFSSCNSSCTTFSKSSYLAANDSSLMHMWLPMNKTEWWRVTAGNFLSEVFHWYDFQLNPTRLIIWNFFVNNLHSPHEIISMVGKTRQDAQQKLKWSWKLFVHISNKSASIKPKDVPIKPSKLLCSNLILFYSKSCKLKIFPAVILTVHLCHEWALPKSTGCKVVSFVINVAYFNHILLWSNCKELLLPLAEEEIRRSKYITRTKPWYSWQDEYMVVSYQFYCHFLRKLSAPF